MSPASPKIYSSKIADGGLKRLIDSQAAYGEVYIKIFFLTFPTLSNSSTTPWFSAHSSSVSTLHRMAGNRIGSKATGCHVSDFKIMFLTTTLKFCFNFCIQILWIQIHQKLFYLDVLWRQFTTSTIVFLLKHKREMFDFLWITSQAFSVLSQRKHKFCKYANELSRL